MSIVASKTQRYAVTFGNRLMYVNATSEGEALSKSRTSLLREHSLLKTEPHEDLATQDRYDATTRVRLSLRY